MGNFLNGLLGFFLGLVSIFFATPLALALGILTGEEAALILPVFSFFVMVASPTFFWIVVPIIGLFRK